MYSVRAATAEDLKQLPAIERAAAQMFRASPYPGLADSALAAHTIESGRDRVWIVALGLEPVGFTIMRSHDSALHIQEIDVHPSHARQGLGAMLIREMARVAKSEGKSWLTLTTMSDVAWNGPYYARLGFKEVPSEMAGADLQAILAEEERAGIPMTHRICMRISLE